MTENEAIELAIRCVIGVCDEGCAYYGADGVCRGYEEVAKGLEKALEEIQQYRAIGTVEELQELKGVITDFPLDCGDTATTFKEILHQLSEYLKIGTIEEFKALKEKSVPKKPIKYEEFSDLFECPSCGRSQKILYQGYHCKECGQKLDWE